MKKIISSKPLFIAVLIWTMAVTILRTIRMPNNYSMSHWLFDYRFGFMKRGIIGSVCSFFTSIAGIPMSPKIIAFLSGTIFAMFILSFLYIILKVLEKHNYGTNISILTLVFVSSPFFVMSGHLFGYFDALLYVCIIFSLIFIEKENFIAASLISSFAILVHESYFLIGLPVIYLAIYLKNILITDKRKKIRNYLIALIPSVVFMVLTFYGIFFVDNKTLCNDLIAYINSFDFVYAGSKSAPHWQTVGFVELLMTQKKNMIDRIFEWNNLAAYFPTLLAILFFIHSNFNLKFFKKESTLIILAVLSPLLMLIIAFDVARLSLNTVGVGFIALWMYSGYRKSIQSNEQFVLIAFFALLINIFVKVVLMDNEVDKFSSFYKALLYSPAIIYSIFIINKDDNKLQREES